MIRSCLLIGAPGSIENRNFLNGVPVDMINMKNYLMSNTGGAWKSSEIRTIMNPTKQALLSSLKLAKMADFSFVLFSGHGGTSTRDGQTYIEINSNGDDFPVEGLINFTDRELIIIDSCRSYYTPPTTLEGDAMLKGFNESSNLAMRYRSIYDRSIMESEFGPLILYACSKGEAANDTEFGGVFTQSLISVGKSIERENRSMIKQPINSTFFRSSELVTQRYRTQHPVMSGSTKRNNWYPFALKL